jgi:hypothetical protein
LLFDRVTALKCRKFQQASKVAVLTLLAVAFEQRDPPAGAVTLTFSGGRRCGSRSNASKPSLPISARRGRRKARPAHAEQAAPWRG